MKKKFLTLLFATILLVTPTLTNAEDFVHEINRQAAELAQQKKSKPTTTKTPTTYTQTKPNSLTLTIGSENSRVSNLQRFLTQTVDFTHPTITGYFGPVTARAVQKYQCRLNIVCSGSPTTTGYGQMGPSTRAAVSAKRGLATITTTIQPTTPTQSTTGTSLNLT